MCACIYTQTHARAVYDMFRAKTGDFFIGQVHGCWVNIFYMHVC